MRVIIKKYLSTIWDANKDRLIISCVVAIIIFGYVSPLILGIFGGEHWGIFSWELWLAIWGWILYLYTAYILWLFFAIFGDDDNNEWS